MNVRMNESRYIFPLSIQLPPVDNIYAQSMVEKFQLLQKYGFSGVELNITDLQTDPVDLMLRGKGGPPGLRPMERWSLGKNRI